MARENEHPTTSEPRIVASSKEERESIEFALSQAESHTVRMPPSPTTGRLKVALQVLRRVVDSWDARPPTDEQLTVLREQVAETLRLARTNSPTVRLRRSA
jgi:hypothetical protein